MPFSQTIRMVINDPKLLLFGGAVFLYAVAGSPTPDKPGLMEAVIALLMMMAIGFGSLVQNFHLPLSVKMPRWQMSGRILLLYGLSIPLITALINDAPFSLILRDMIGFIFLCLPLFLFGFFEETSIRQKAVAALAIIIGVFFALRVLLPGMWFFNTTHELLYLANSPLVLFSALFLVGATLQSLFERIDSRHVIFAAVGGLLSAILITAMFADIQRASFAALFITPLFLFACGLIKAPLRLIIPVTLAVLVIFSFGSLFTDILEGVHVKTSQVGFNMRLQELNAVWDSVSHSWGSIIFGQGWGSSFTSPAVGGLNVTYTHSLISYMFLKTGIAGLFLSAIYMFFIFEKMAHLYFSDPVKGNALMWPLLIPIFLYASYKSFDYGVLLTFILVMAIPHKRVTV